jgi:hypothetical protein
MMGVYTATFHYRVLTIQHTHPTPSPLTPPSARNYIVHYILSHILPQLTIRSRSHNLIVFIYSYTMPSSFSL